MLVNGRFGEAYRLHRQSSVRQEAKQYEQRALLFDPARFLRPASYKSVSSAVTSVSNGRIYGRCRRNFWNYMNYSFILMFTYSCVKCLNSPIGVSWHLHPTASSILSGSSLVIRFNGFPDVNSAHVIITKPNVREYNWATLFLEEINTGTWPSMLRKSQNQNQ
jgi:hypothetical protein